MQKTLDELATCFIKQALHLMPDHYQPACKLMYHARSPMVTQVLRLMKSDVREGCIMLPDDTHGTLAIPQSQEFLRLFDLYSSTTPCNGYVLGGHKPWTASTVDNVLRNACKEAKIPYVRLMMLLLCRPEEEEKPCE